MSNILLVYFIVFMCTFEMCASYRDKKIDVTCIYFDVQITQR
jgi:hypothetical protein